MRMTLSLADDVAAAARDGRTLGEVVSDLALQTLRRSGPAFTKYNGSPMLPKRGVVVTLELVNALRDEDD